MQKEERVKDLRDVYQHLREAAYFSERAAGLEAQRHGSSLEQLRLVTALARSKEALRPSQLARRALREAHTMSGLLDRMEKDGLTRRNRNHVKGHKNWVQVTLTPKGVELHDQAPDFDEVEVSPLGALSQAELTQLDGLLLRVRDAAIENVRQLAPIWAAEDAD